MRSDAEAGGAQELCCWRVEKSLKIFINFDSVNETVLEFKASLIAAGFTGKRVPTGALRPDGTLKKYSR